MCLTEYETPELLSDISVSDTVGEIEAEAEPAVPPPPLRAVVRLLRPMPLAEIELKMEGPAGGEGAWNMTGGGAGGTRMEGVGSKPTRDLEDDERLLDGAATRLSGWS